MIYVIQHKPHKIFTFSCKYFHYWSHIGSSPIQGNASYISIIYYTYTNLIIFGIIPSLIQT